jgi:hypothetical protein
MRFHVYQRKSSLRNGAQPVATANGPKRPWLISNVRQKMKIYQSRFLPLLLLLTLGGCCSPPDPKLVAAVEVKRARIMSLVSVGMEITEAQKILEEAGFVPAYRKPILPTVLRNYQEQLFLLTPFNPSFSQTFRYSTGMKPCPSQFRPYVQIEADLSGKITEIR